MNLGTSKCFKVIPKRVNAELPETCPISAEQFKFYHDNGYLVIKGLIDFASLYTYKQHFIRLAKGLEYTGNMTVVKEPSLAKKGYKGEDLINKLQDILFDEVFTHYFEHPRLLHAVSQFIGPDTGHNVPPGGELDPQYGDNLTAMHSMFINKPPGAARHPPHQDMYYFPFRPARKVIAAWTAIDDVTLDNGALYVIPGSHLRGVIHTHGNVKDSNKMYHGILEEESIAPPGRRVHLEMSPGDTVFFHPLLVHGSGPNITQRHRKSISCHYANTDCTYVDTSGTVQAGIAAEVEAEAQRRGITLTFQEIWKYRSKPVKGKL